MSQIPPSPVPIRSPFTRPTIEDTLVSTTILAAHPCGLPMTITWNVNGGPDEQIDHILDDTSLNPAQISFDHVYPPGRHTIIARADDGIVPPTLFMTSVTVLAPASTTLMGVVTDDGLPEEWPTHHRLDSDRRTRSRHHRITSLSPRLVSPSLSPEPTRSNSKLTIPNWPLPTMS
jgi:hypothetical protein